MTEWNKDFQSRTRRASINYQPTGSGAGVQAFIQGTADFAGSDSALKADEGAAAGRRPVQGRQGHQPADGDRPDRRRLQRPRRGQPAAHAGDPGEDLRRQDHQVGRRGRSRPTTRSAKLPATTIQAVHRSDESGTTDNFTKYLEGRDGRLDLRARQGVEGPGRRQAPRAPTAWPARSRAPTAPSATSSCRSPRTAS